MKATKVTVKGNYVIAKAPGVRSVAVVEYKNGYKQSIYKSVEGNEKVVCIRMPETLKGEVSVSYFPLEKKEGKKGSHEKFKQQAGYPQKAEDYADRGTKPMSYPIQNAEKVHAALSYFGGHGHKFGDPKHVVAERILRAAKKFGIKVSKDSDVYKAAHGSE